MSTETKSQQTPEPTAKAKKTAARAAPRPNKEALERLVAEAGEYRPTNLTGLIHRWETERLMRHTFSKKTGVHTVALAGLTGSSSVSKDIAVQNLTNRMRRELKRLRRP